MKEKRPMAAAKKCRKKELLGRYYVALFIVALQW